jgi:hypothetical protein
LIEQKIAIVSIIVAFVAGTPVSTSKVDVIF